MMVVRPRRGLLFVRGAALQLITHADALDDQDAVFDLDIAFGLRHEPALIRRDPARLQRATQGAGQSTGRRRNHIVERRRVRFE